MKLDREGLIYICYVSQKEWGEHGRVKEYWGPKGIRGETFSQLIKDIYLDSGRRNPEEERKNISEHIVLSSM